MLDHESAALLTGGSALIVGTVGPGAMPHAMRAWGLEVLADEPLRVRILLDAHEREAIADLSPGAAVAVTAADVRTLRSIQLKGRAVGTEPAVDGDAAVMDRYVRAFFDDIEDTDGTPRAVLERALPDPERLVRLVIDVEDRFDQTPGPHAGRTVDTAP